MINKYPNEKHSKVIKILDSKCNSRFVNDKLYEIYNI